MPPTLRLLAGSDGVNVTVSAVPAAVAAMSAAELSAARTSAAVAAEAAASVGVCVAVYFFNEARRINAVLNPTPERIHCWQVERRRLGHERRAA